MKKAIMIAFLFCFLYSGAQDEKPARLNIMAGYSAGLQFFKLNKIENVAVERLKRNASSEGFYHVSDFSPTLIHHISLSATFLKNKNYFIELNADWGSNNLSSFSYTVDNNSNPLEVKSKSSFTFLAVGIGIKKKISLGKYGAVFPKISFHNIGADYKINLTYTIKDKTTGNIITEGKGIGTNGSYDFGRNGLLMLFDSPKIGFDYNIEVYNNLSLTFSYSYWWANTIINDLYSNTRSYIIKFRGSANRTPAYFSQWKNDLYSHNISLGVCFKLRQ